MQRDDLTINGDNEQTSKQIPLHWQVLYNDEPLTPESPNGNLEINTTTSPVELTLQFASEEFLELRVEAEVTFPSPNSGEDI